jgi:hypothetical protein
MNTFSLHPLARRGAAIAALTFVPAAHAAWIDYAQADTSSSATTIVLVSAVGSNMPEAPAGVVTAGYTRWHTGEAGGIGYVYRWRLTGDPHHWLVGLGAGANGYRSRVAGDDDRQSALSARFQSEWDGPAPGGSYYALAQASTFRQSWLAVAQYSPAALPVAAEWTRYHERGYQSTSLGLRIAVGVPRWYVRIGATHATGETNPYIGIAYNGF